MVGWSSTIGDGGETEEIKEENAMDLIWTMENREGGWLGAVKKKIGNS